MRKGAQGHTAEVEDAKKRLDTTSHRDMGSAHSVSDERVDAPCVAAYPHRSNTTAQDREHVHSVTFQEAVRMGCQS